MTLPAIDIGRNPDRKGIFLLVAGFALPIVFIWFLLHTPIEVVERYKTFWAATNIKLVNTAKDVIPEQMRASVLFNSLFDSDLVTIEFKIGGNKYSMRLGMLKKCLSATTDVCAENVKISKRCIRRTLQSVKPFKRVKRTVSGAGTKVSLLEGDIAYDIGGASLVLVNKLNGLFSDLCKGKLGRARRVILPVQVKPQLNQPNTDGSVAKKYVEIDYSRQLLFLWQDGKYSMFKISGPANTNYALGVFKVYSKSRLAWSGAYRAWMPYWLGYTKDRNTRLGVGIHALTYSCPGKVKYCSPRHRIYEPVSELGVPLSDGCVRLKMQDASKVFSAINIGDIIIVHK